MANQIWTFIFIAVPTIAVITAVGVLFDNITGAIGEAASKAEQEKQNDQ
jgi:hypothetical protein